MAIPTLVKQGQIAFTYDAWDALPYGPIVHQDDDGTYRMFYTGYTSDGLNYGPCVATSADFVTWTKPILNQVTFGADSDNNIFIVHDVHNLTGVSKFGSTYVAIIRNSTTTSNLIYTSTDGETWSFVKTAFTNTSHGEHVEAKGITFEGGVYRIYYSEGHFVPDRRSIGYYQSATLDGTWTDQGLITAFTSSGTDDQYYDFAPWKYAGGLYACVPDYTKSTEILGPLKTYQSTDDGVTWTLVDTLLEMGAGGTFDDELITATFPILINHHWSMVYVGSSEGHDIWPRPMVFALATGRENTSMSLTYHAPFYQTKSLAPVIGPTATCTRALGSATYYDSSGVLQTAAADTARFDHNPTTGESLGLLVEEARTNLVLQSEDFSTSWTVGSGAIVTNVGTGQDGTATADRFDVTAESAQHRVFQQLTSSGATDYTLSCHVKDDGSPYVGLLLLGATNDWITVVYNIDTGTVTQESEGATTGTIVDSGIKDVGGGWYRIWMSGQVATANAFFIIQQHFTPTPTLTTGGGEIFVAVAGTDTLLWGAQAEAGTFPTSYIKTTTGTQLRNTDAVFTNDVSWYNDSAATWYIKSSSKDLTADRYVLAIGAGTSGADALSLLYDLAAGNFTAFRGTTTGNDGSIGFTGVATADVPMKVATAYANNDMVSYVDGVAGTPDTVVTLPPTNVADIMRLGRDAGSTLFLNGHIAEIRYNNERLPDATVQSFSLGSFGVLSMKLGINLNIGL